MTFHCLPRRLFLAGLLAAPLAAQAGDMGMAHKGDIQISDAWVRVALPNRPTAGYMMLMNGGGAGDRLVAANSPDFETIELHESSMKDGVMSMTPIEAVAHSPTPPIVRIAASSNGEGKKALAACDSWCSA